MKKILILSVLITALFLTPVNASVTPGDSTITKSISVKKLWTYDPGEIQKRTGKKLSFVEKIKIAIFQKKLLRQAADENDEPTEKQKKQGKISMILGITSIILLPIPYLGIIAIPAAVTALVLGLKSIKGNSNTRGIVGVITGSVTLFIFIIALIVLAAWVSAWN
jgi:hypothetical protein